MRSSFFAFALITLTLSATQVAAQNDSRSPTDPTNPLKQLVDKLNDPQGGAALRAQWNIDRAVWVEPGERAEVPVKV